MRAEWATTVVGLALGATLAGCKGNEAPGGATTGDAPSTSSAAASAAPAASSEPAASNSPFHVVAQAPDSFAIYAIQGAGFVDAAGFLAKLDEGDLVQSPALMKGLEKDGTGTVMGTSPDGIWLVRDKTYKWVNATWADTQLLREGEKLLDIAAWDDKRAVAAIGMPHNDMRFFLVGGKTGVVMPAPGGVAKEKKDAPAASAEAAPADAPPAEGAPAEADDSCKVKMKPDRLVLAGTASGHLFAAGFECKESGHGSPIAERWEPKKVRGTTEPLPKSEGEVALNGAVAVAADQAYVFGDASGKAYLAKWDGKGWALEAPAIDAGIQRMVAADDGTLWAVTSKTEGSALWKRPSGGAWSEVPLPPGMHAEGIYARTAAEVWVAAKSHMGGALLRTTPAKTVAKLPSRKDMSDTIATNRRWLATPACAKVYAHLATISPSQNGTAPVPKDFTPYKETFTRPEFASVAPIVEDDGASYYVGAPVPSLEVGEKLLAAYKEKNPKAQPRLFCHEPVIVKKAIKFE